LTIKFTQHTQIHIRMRDGKLYDLSTPLIASVSPGSPASEARRGAGTRHQWNLRHS
jgi:hypothetical protein